MPVWVVRGGKHGQREVIALEKGFLSVGWSLLPDLSKIKTKDQLSELYIKHYTEEKKMSIAQNIGQLWRFINTIKIDQLVIMPLKTQSIIAIGKIIGEYEYKEELGAENKHTRQVEWFNTLPRSAFDEDILVSINSTQLTVFQIRRDNVEKRVTNILKKKPREVIPTDEGGDEIIDIEQQARDQIEKFIDRNFKGHSLEELVSSILASKGFVIKTATPGPDGGVDILAGSGPLGFDNPRICVQVKSTASPIGETVLRELKGVMRDFKADQGLLVSFGGFKTTAIRAAKMDYFSIRLWDAGAVLDEIFKSYKNFGDKMKAKLPLKRFWTLVPEDIE